MLRLNRFTVFMLLAFFLAGEAAFAGTHYIAANGTDSNDGASKSTAWAHAPGMSNCASNCASYKPVAGDQFIFRGGDTWTVTTNVQTCPGTNCWINWQWSGSSGNPIYIGVDKTWYSGASWARPIITGGNTLSTGFVASCTTDDTNIAFVYIGTVSYVTFDNFEFTGKCWTGINTYNGSISENNATHLIISNNYFHGWTTTTTSLDNHFMILGHEVGTGTQTYNQFVGNVFDGSDSSHAAAGSAPCTTQGFDTTLACQSGEAIYAEGYDVHNNVFRYLSNVIVVNNSYTVHDNLFEYLYQSYDGRTHPNLLNMVSGNPAWNSYIYNNVIRHTSTLELFFITIGVNGYFFNNVMYDNMPTTNLRPGNCIMLGDISSGGTTNFYFVNNTIVNDAGGCNIRGYADNAPNYSFKGTVHFQNNHLLGYASNLLSTLYTTCGSGACTWTDNGNEILQTIAVANGQGYTSTNMYQPTTGGSTIGTGANLVSSCSAYSADSALCSGTTDSVSLASGSGGLAAAYPAIALVPRPAGNAWDAGAYFFGGTSAGLPSPPSGLLAIVQ